MTPVNVAAFVTRWHGALPPSQPNDSALLQSQSPGETAKKLNLQLQQRPELMRLAATPLLCAMICALHRERLETLPSARLKLYSECIDMLLNRRDAGRKIELDGSYPVGLDEAQKLELLQSLALKLMRANLSSLETERVDEHFGRELRNTNLPEEVKGEQIRALFVERAALLREPTVGQIDFAHRTFQEYLAAKAVLDDDSLEELLQKAADDQWREAIISATGLAGQKQRGKLLLSLIKQGNGNLASQARNKLISLAGKAANEEEVKNRKYLHLLAVACLETATSVDRGIRDHVLENARAIMPPQDDDEVAMVVRAGNEVVPLLTFESGYSGEEASRCIQALVAIGTSAAMEQLVAYATAEFESAQGSVAAALGKGWDIFNRDVYLEKVLCNSKTLNLSQTQVSDLSPLKALSQLQNLSLSQTQVSDLSPLKALSQLQILHLNQTQVSDLSPLKELSQLWQLYLNQTQVSDLSSLKALSQLQILSVEQTKVTDRSPLKHLKNLIILPSE